MIAGAVGSPCNNAAAQVESVNRDGIILSENFMEPEENPDAAAVVGNGACGKGLKWKLTSDGILNITGDGSMSDYTAGGSPWQDLDVPVTQLVMEEGIAAIGANAFYGCDHLTDVNIPASVIHISGGAFERCDSLKSITIRNASCKIDDNMGIKETVVIYGYHDSTTQVYAQTHGIFMPIDSKEPEADVVDSGSCGEKMTWKLTSEGILTIDGEGRMENYNSETEEGTKTPPWTPYAERIKKAVLCEGIESVGDRAFENCTFLTEIEMPSSMVIGDEPNFDYSEFYVVSHIPSLENITVSSNNTKLSSDDGILYDKDKTKLICYPQGKQEDYLAVPSGVIWILSTSFEKCVNLKEIMIPDSVEGIGSYAFDGCGNLESVALPSGLSHIGNAAFKNCSQLKNIKIPANISLIGKNVFYGCSSLTSIVIPASVERIRLGAFRGCVNLKSIYIWNPSCSIDDLYMAHTDDPDINAEFWEHNDDGDIEGFKDGATISKTAVIHGYTGSTAQEYAKRYKRKFAAFPVKGARVKDKKTKDIYIVKKAGISAVYAGTAKKNKTSITIPSEVTIDSITYQVTSIAGNAFKNNKKLKKAVIPESVKSIGASAFYGCTAIKSITIPENVNAIGNKAFYNCRKMSSLIIKSEKLTQKKIGSQAFTKAGSIKYRKLTVKVPSGKYKAYKKILKNRGLSSKVKVKR